MKKIFISGVLFFVFIVFTTLANADLKDFLDNLNNQAATDRHTYNTRLSNQFGISVPRAESIVRSVDSPADAFMLLQLSSMTGKTYNSVFNSYKRNRKKGWGTIAKELGIKPGSPEFHAFKRGDFVFSGKRGEKGYRHHDNRDKDRDRDKNRHWEDDTGKGKDVARDAETAKGKGHGKNK